MKRVCACGQSFFCLEDERDSIVEDCCMLNLEQFLFDLENNLALK